MHTNDHNHRTQAINVKKSYIIQAPAGSGKTELLTQRILNLLANSVNKPEEILAITFTKKAAHEMHERVHNALLDAKNKFDSPTDAHKLLTWNLSKKVLKKNQSKQWNLLDNPKRLKVSTIDSFCQTIVKSIPILSEMTQNPEVTEDGKLLYESCIKQLLTDTNPQSPWMSSLKNIMENVVNNNIESFIRLLCTMLEKREQWMPLLLNNDIPNIKNILNENFTYFINEQLQIIHNEFQLLEIKQWEELISFSQYHLTKKQQKIHLSNSVDTLNNWQLLIKIAFTSSQAISLRKRVDKRLGFPSKTDSHKDERENNIEMKSKWKIAINNLEKNSLICEKLKFINGLNKIEYSKNEWETLNDICVILKVACQYLQITFAEKNTIDFNQIQLSTISALGNSNMINDISLYLDYKLKHILIDEFQDTSITQFKIIKQLTKEWIPNDGNTLFLVGDPMQSIYRFRQAEVQRFIEVKNHGIGNIKPKPLTLTSNFRSSATIINWINATFSKVLPTIENQHLGAIRYTQSDSIKNYTNSYVRQHLSQSDSQEAKLIIDEIKKIMPYKHEKIAIIAKTRKDLKAIINELNINKIPFSETDIQDLSQLEIIKDLTALTLSLICTHDGLSWAELLHSKIFGLNMDQIEKIISVDLNKSIYDNIEKLIELQSPIVNWQIETLITYYQSFFLNERPPSLSKVIYRLWCDLNGPQIHKGAISHLERFFIILDNYTPNGLLKERQVFLNKLENLKAEANIDHDINIMTLHKSKGLEFDTVFLIGLNKNRNTDKDELLKYDSFIFQQSKHKILLAPKVKSTESNCFYELIKKTNNKRSFLEEQRLLYVATTRAKKRLILSASLNDKTEPESSSLLNHIWSQTKQGWIIHDADKITDNVELKRMYFSPKTTIVRTRTTIIKPYKQNLLNMESNLPSPYTTKSFIEREIGKMVHRILENYTVDHIQNKHLVLTKFLDKFKPNISTQKHIENILTKLYNNLKQDEMAKWIFKNRKVSFKELVTHKLSYNGKLIEKIIDYTFVENNICWVIDFKTSTPSDNESLSEFLIKEEQLYCQQLNNYKFIMQKKLQLSTKIALYFPIIPYFHEIKN